MLRNVNGFVDLHRFIAVPTIIIKNKNSLTPPPLHNRDTPFTEFYSIQRFIDRFRVRIFKFPHVLFASRQRQRNLIPLVMSRMFRDASTMKWRRVLPVR